MAIEHDSIADAEIHEPKGAAGATAYSVYVADGAGSGNWENPSPHAGCYYSNIGTGFTLTTPTTYTIINPTTTATHLHEFTHNGNGRLTYTGAPDRHGFFTATLSIKHSTGSGDDIYIAAYKNGVIVPGGEFVRTASSTGYGSITICFDGAMVQNDYVELYAKVAGGNIVIHAMSMMALGSLE